MSPLPIAHDFEVRGRAVAKALVECYEANVWQAFEEPRVALLARTPEAYAHEALRIYAITYPAESLFVALETEPSSAIQDEDVGACAGAISVLNDIAGGYALLTRDWRDEQVIHLPFTNRDDAKRALSIAGADLWIERTAHTTLAGDFAMIRERNTSLINSAMDIEVEHTAASPREADEFLAVLQGYESVHELWTTPGGSGELQQPALRAHVVAFLAHARVSAFRDVLNLGFKFAPIVVTQIHLAAAAFMMTWQDPANAPGLPSQEFLRWSLDYPSMREWFETRGASVPAWLTGD